MTEMRTHFVSVLVPCRNEVRHIRIFLQSLLAQQLGPGLECEILIADGMSDDGTRDVLGEWQSRFKALVVIDNHNQTVSSGLNAAILRANGDIIVRMDVHSEYAPDYIQQCVNVLDETGADNVGGPALACGTTYVQKAICVAYRFPFGCGGARFHDPYYEGLVDTVTYGCWRRSTLERIGLFDEMLVRNQDDELNLRLARQGGKIWQTPRIRSWYYPRASLAALGRQYGQYGYWKVYVMRKHRLPASWRHLAPGTFVAALLLFGITAPFAAVSAAILKMIVGTYAVANLGASVVACRKPENLVLLSIMPVVFATYHLSYGLGFLRAMLDIAFHRRPAGSAIELVR
jgi:glycosyltransferase involved in cell wall biosynthesis